MTPSPTTKLQRFGWLPLLQLACGSLCLAVLLFLALNSIWGNPENALVWGIGVCALLVLFIPVYSMESYDLFQPVSFLALTTLFGVTLRSIYIVEADPSSIQKFLIGEQPSSVIPAGLIIISALMVFMAGYMMRTPVIRISRFVLFRKNHWSRKRLFLVIVTFMFISILGFTIFIKELGITVLTVSDLSSKHNVVGEGIAKKYASLGYCRWAASLMGPAFYLLFTWFAASRRRWFSLSGFFVLWTALMAIAFPVFTSSRGGVVETFIICMVIWHYIRSEIRVSSLLIAVFGILSVILILSALRKDVNDPGLFLAYFLGEKILEVMVGNHNFFGIEKTAAIMDAIPGKLDYEYGRTLLLWLIAPIPRALWEAKPVISTGQIIGQFVYRQGSGAFGAGVPPGFIPEMYWNFGLAGVYLGMFALGRWLKFIYASFRNVISHNKNAVIIYVSLVMTFAFEIPGGNFSGSLIESLTEIIPLLFSLWFIGKQEQRLIG